MRTTLTAVVLAVMGNDALALSCIRPDPISTFKQLAAAPESYFVLQGELTFDESALPPSIRDVSGDAPTPIRAQFNGLGLTKDGFTATYVSPVTLEISCAGPWCGSARSGGDAIYFVEATTPLATVLADPCGSRIFAEPSQDTLNTLVSCMQGGPCSPQALQ
ncbi:MAG: hypothetical protein AAFQ09_02235 [Pseudomonadota bacterium]